MGKAAAKEINTQNFSISRVLSVLFAVFFWLPALAQDKMSYTDSVEKEILVRINQLRNEGKTDELDTNFILLEAARLQSGYMASKNEVSPEQKDKKFKTTEKRVEFYGGSRNAEELVQALPARNGPNRLPAAIVAENAVKKWTLGKKTKDFLLDGTQTFAGVGCSMDSDGKKIYISVVLGHFNIFNLGKNYRDSLSVPFTVKTKKLKKAEDKACKSCDKFKDPLGLHSGLSVEDNSVVLRYEDLRALRRIMKEKKDALAVEIVQKEQYRNKGYNIYDNNLVTKGILLPPVYRKKFFSANRAVPAKKGGKVKSLDLVMGKLPENLKGPYELNILLIQDKHVCKRISRSFLLEGSQNSYTPVEMIWIPDSTAYFDPPYDPAGETKTLEFTIPFEKNKSEYNPEDIKPFLESLRQPDFIIDRLSIQVFASVEGDSVQNRMLQQKRAESIVKAMEQRQENKKIHAQIYFGDSWENFCTQVKGTSFENLCAGDRASAQKDINANADALEPYLAPTRMAKIKMDISYDLRGNKEENFCVVRFNEAVADSNFTKMYKIMYYLGKGAFDKKFSPQVLDKMQIPNELFYSEVLMNREVFKYKVNKKVLTDANVQKMSDLKKMDRCSYYIEFNDLFCFIKKGEFRGDQKEMDEIQKRIDELYKSPIPEKTMDALNIEYQFKMIDFVDTSEAAAPTIQKCMDRIKGFYDLKQASWQNSLKLAFVFINFHEYKKAIELIEKFVDEPGVDEQLLFTYISLAAQFEEMERSKRFIKALRKAREINNKRYCDLFGEPFLSFQLLDIPQIKQDYLEGGCWKD